MSLPFDERRERPDASTGDDKAEQRRNGDSGLLKQLLDNPVEPILTISRDGIIQTASRAALRLLGFHRAQVLGKHARMLLPHLERDRYEEHLARYLTKQGPLAAGGACEVNLERRDGLKLPVHLSVIPCVKGNAPVYVVMLRDASEHTTLLQELQRELDFSDRVIETAPILMHLLDLDGRLIRANRHLAQVAGCGPAASVGRSWCENFIAPEDQGEFQAHLRDVKSKADSVQCCVIALLTKDGRTRRIQWHSTLLRDADVAIGILSVGLDVTEEQRKDDQLARSQKLEALGRLTGGIAHDFNNLLMGVLGCGKQALDRMEPGHPALPFLEEIMQATQRTVQLTRRLLTFSRREPTTCCVVDVMESVRAVASIARQVIGADITLSTRFSCAQALVEGDGTQIEQMLMNLVINARDAMPNGGVLSIRVSEDAAPAALASAGHVTIEVEDTGCGMSAKTQQRIFEPFFTTKPPGQGTGLGLATVLGIVSRMHGLITVDSALGLGTCIRINLPRSCKEREAKAAATNRDGPPLVRGHGETILLVEDEAIVRISLQRAIESLDYKAIVAPDGAQAIDMIGKGARFDVLLTDVVLPGICGPELARRLRMSNPALRVVFMSAHSREHLLAQDKLLPEDLSLEKPFSTEQLAQKLCDAIQPCGLAGA